MPEFDGTRATGVTQNCHSRNTPMKRIPFLPLLGIFLLAPAVRATVLVYEGFGPSDYSPGVSIRDNTASFDSIGLDTVSGWFAHTGVYTSQDNGLSLPASWTASGSTVHGTKDYRCAFGSSTAFSDKAARRAQQRALSCTWPTSGSIYFRFLMHVPKALLTTNYLPNWGFILGGLGAHEIANAASDSPACTVTNGVYMGYRRNGTTIETLAYVRADGGALSSYPVFTADSSKDLDLVCVAKIDIGENGNDTLSLYLTTVDNWNDDFEWTETIPNIALLSGPNPLRYLQMLGQYKTNGNMASFDEFIVTTDPNEAYYHRAPAAPMLGDVSLVRTGAGTYSITAAEAVNDASLSWILDDGATVTTNGMQTVTEGNTVSWTVSGLAPNKTYRISVLSNNGDGVDVKEAGTIYTGALSLGATTNANETDLVPGGVVVSRNSADPWPLTVNYAIAGSAGSAGVTWEAPVPVTIPANATDATLPVTPRTDSSVDENVRITVSLADGNYGLPAENAATLTLFNRKRFKPAGYIWRTIATPSTTIQAMLGDSAFEDFPVLLRLPPEVSANLLSESGTDLCVVDENDAILPFEVDTFNPVGTTFVWVKVPSLSAATELSVFFNGAANSANTPASVWSDFAGVWHYAPSCVGSTTVPDSSGNGFNTTSAQPMQAYAGPGGLDAIQSGARIDAPDYDLALPNVAVFSASGWFKSPLQTTHYWSAANKKVGITTGPNGENLWNIDKGWQFQFPGKKNVIRFAYTASADINIPDVTQNWNYFNIASDGSTIKIYMNGATVASASVSYRVKASGTVYLMCSDAGSCVREYRIRKSAASATETALEYATVADEEFFGYGEAVRVGTRTTFILMR